MKLRTNIIILTILLQAVISKAQTEKIQVEELPPDKTLSSEGKKIKAMFKVECLNWLQGRQEFSLEIPLNKEFNVQVGGGFTFRPILSTALVFNDLDYQYGSLFTTNVNYNFAKSKYGDFYAGVAYKYYQYKLDYIFRYLELPYPFGQEYESRNETQTNHIGQFRVGWQVFLDNGFVLDFFTGKGIGYSNVAIQSNSDTKEQNDIFFPTEFGFRMGFYF